MNAQPSAHSTQLVWLETGDFKPGISTEVCKFDYNGRRYHAYRAVGGALLALSKRERTNREGVFFTRLNLQGAAARKVLAAVTLP